MRGVEIAIISPEILFRQGVASLIAQSSDAFTLQQYLTTQSYVMQTTQNWKGIIILDDDLALSQMMQDFIEQIHALRPLARIVVMSHFMSEGYINRMLDLGVAGFIYKRDHLEESLVVGIKTVLDGHFYLSPKASIIPYKRQTDTLNQTDRDVLQLLAMGYTVQQIAGRMGLSRRTIYRSRNRIRLYLKVKNNDLIVDKARKYGLIP